MLHSGVKKEANRELVKSSASAVFRCHARPVEPCRKPSCCECDTLTAGASCELLYISTAQFDTDVLKVEFSNKEYSQ